MEELVVLPNEAQPAQSQDQIQSAQTMPLDQLKSVITQAQSGQPPTQPVTPATPPPAVQGGQVAVAEQGQPQGQVTENKNEPKPDATPTFAELQQKAGFKDPDALAKSYQELRRELEKKFQEAASLRKQVESGVLPQQPQAQPQQPAQANPDELFAQRVAQVGVTRAVAELARAITLGELKPLNEQSEEIRIKNAVKELETSPITAQTFANPEVQSEIKKVIAEEPDYFYQNLAKTLPIAYERALGRLALRGAASKPAQAQPAAAIMEGKQKPIMPQPFNPETASLDEMEKYLKSILG